MHKLLQVNHITPNEKGELFLNVVRVNEISDGEIKRCSINVINHQINHTDWMDEESLDDAIYRKCCDVATKVEFKKSSDDYTRAYPCERGSVLLGGFLRESRKIAVNTQRGCGNVIVLNKAAKNILDSLDYPKDLKGTTVTGLYESMYVAYSEKLNKYVLVGSIILHEYDDKSDEPHILIAYVGQQAYDNGILVADVNNKYTIIDDIDGAKNYYTLITLKE